MALNITKTSIIIFDRQEQCDAILAELGDGNTAAIIEQKSAKYLGLIVDNKLKFSEHIDYVKSKVAKRIGALHRSKKLLPLKFRKMFVNALMLPQFDYLDIVWCKANKIKLDELDILYKKVAKIALDVGRRESSVTVYKEMKWLPLHIRRQLHLACYMFRIVNGLSPKNYMNKFSYISGGTRDGNNCNLYINKSRSHKEFFYLGAKCWNLLPQSVRSAEYLKDFSEKYKKQLLESVLQDSNYTVNNKFDIFYGITD